MELEEAIKRLNIIKSKICYDSDEENENKEAIKDILAIEVILKELDNYKTDNETIEILLKDYKDKINKIIDYVDLQINLLTETINGYRYDDKIVDKNIIALFKEKCEYIKRILNNEV